MTIKHRLGRENMGHCQHHSTLDVRHIDALQIERSALTRRSGGSGMPMNLDAANPDCAPHGVDFDLLFLVNATCDQRAGHNSPKALHREATVDRQTKNIRVVSQADLTDAGPKSFN